MLVANPLVAVLVLLLHAVVQVAQELLEHEGVDVLAELVQQEPVADAELAAQTVHLK